MASGGQTELEGAQQAPRRSRTGLVIDQLLSRGPLLGTTAAAPGRPASGVDPWMPVAGVLGVTATSILEAHLTWLVDRARALDTASPSRTLVEDQIRILVRGLEDRGEDAVISLAFGQPWRAEEISDTGDDIAAYVSALRQATGGQPAHSPYGALVDTADGFAGAVDDDRRSALPRRRFA